MRAFRNLLGLLRELWAFARHHRAWWMVPIVVLLLLIGAVLVGVSAASPFVYSLF